LVLLPFGVAFFTRFPGFRANRAPLPLRGNAFRAPPIPARFLIKNVFRQISLVVKPKTVFRVCIQSWLGLLSSKEKEEKFAKKCPILAFKDEYIYVSL